MILVLILGNSPLWGEAIEFSITIIIVLHYPLKSAWQPIKIGIYFLYFPQPLQMISQMATHHRIVSTYLNMYNSVRWPKKMQRNGQRHYQSRAPSSAEIRAKN